MKVLPKFYHFNGLTLEVNGATVIGVEATIVYLSFAYGGKWVKI